MKGIIMVLNRDAGQLFHGSAEFLHMTHHHHGVIAGIKSADRIIKTHVRGQGDEFIALPGIDVRHGFKSVSHAGIHHAGSDILICLLETDAAGGAAGFHPVTGQRTQAQIILYHNTGHQLAREVV